MKVKLKRGDTVEVITGRGKGTRGEVIRVVPDGRGIVVRGVNLRKKHQRQIQAAGRSMSPGIIQFEAPVNVSNVMLVCPKCGKLTRLEIHREDGQAQRYCKKCENHIDG
jgi:large subunit ribosomal protein L24